MKFARGIGAAVLVCSAVLLTGCASHAVSASAPDGHTASSSSGVAPTQTTSVAATSSGEPTSKASFDCSNPVVPQGVEDPEAYRIERCGVDMSDYNTTDTEGDAQTSATADSTSAEVDCDDPTVSMADWQEHCSDPAATPDAADGVAADQAAAEANNAEAERVEVPNLIGMSKNDIQRAAWLQRSGVHVSVMTALGYEHSISCQVQGMDEIVDQRPVAGTMVRRGTIVSAQDSC